MLETCTSSRPGNTHRIPSFLLMKVRTIDTSPVVLMAGLHAVLALGVATCSFEAPGKQFTHETRDMH